MKPETLYVIVFAVTLVFTACILYILIPLLKRLKAGQKILGIGPEWHKKKEGTPTMGGISFVVTVTITTVAASFLLGENIAITVVWALYAAACGLIGFTDDLKKIKMKRNEGLTAFQKFALQLIAAAVFVIVLRRYGIIDTKVYLPIFGGYLDLGLWYYIFALLFLTGFENSVNLTDGLDGLCAGVTATVMIFSSAFALKNEDTFASVISFAIIGGCVGFLIFNIHPARVFMGDTGSLFLGAAVSGAMLATGDPILLFFIGIIYVIEAASVIIQVLYFKLTGKRLFLMAPFHHHLEKKGMSENAINLLFIAITAVIGVLCYYLW